MSETSYLKKPSGIDALFGNFTNDNSDADTSSERTMVDIDKLHEFKGHPFKPYDGERFEKMKDSINTLGILEPIIVRVDKSGDYEILSGHNRTNAARELGLKEVPVRILEDIDDELAMLIVTESNIIQRSFSELSHSEKAVIIKNHMEACKCQGKRNDLVKAVDELLTKDNDVIQKSDKNDNLKSTGELYDMSRANIARYVRVNDLISEFKNMMDNEQLGLYVGVNLSYIPDEVQERIYDVYNDGEYKLDIKKSELLRSLAEQQELTEEMIQEVLTDTPKKKSPLIFKNFNIDPFFNKYFSPLQDKKEITKELTSALELLKRVRDGEIKIVEVQKDEEHVEEDLEV